MHYSDPSIHETWKDFHLPLPREPRIKAAILTGRAYVRARQLAETSPMSEHHAHEISIQRDRARSLMDVAKSEARRCQLGYDPLG